MRNVCLSCALLGLGAVVGCSGNALPLETVSGVELERYMGTWYEIASYPVSFQAGCIGTTAQYELNEDGTVDVLNTCFEGSFDADVRTASGSARVVAGSNNAKLKVRFFIFEGDYWILDLGDAEDYGYAVVGTPDRQMLWILSRTPTMDPAIYDAILEQLPEWDFEPDRLSLTPQQVSDPDTVS